MAFQSRKCEPSGSVVHAPNFAHLHLSLFDRQRQCQLTGAGLETGFHPVYLMDKGQQFQSISSTCLPVVVSRFTNLMFFFYGPHPWSSEPPSLIGVPGGPPVNTAASHTLAHWQTNRGTPQFMQLADVLHSSRRRQDDTSSIHSS